MKKINTTLHALQGVRGNRNVAHLQHRLNVINHVVELLLHLGNKQIMPNKVETQHKHIYS